MQTFLDAPATAVILEKLGWVLVHSLWQFAAVAAVTSAATAVAWRAGPRLRHGLFVCGLVAMAALPVVTWHTLDVRPQPQAADATGSGAAAGVLARGAWVPPPDGAARTAAAATPWTAPSGGDAIAEGIRPWLGWLTAAWLVGVATAAVRPLVGWLAWRRLTTTGAAEVPAAVMRMVERARRRLGIGQAVRVVQSAAVRVPAVAGWLRPVMLVPLALVTSLAPRELETLIVHELAHVRRGDLLVHILQLLLETIAFYHPAVWWLSARIRVEREHCCDDLVVATTGDCAAYGRALVAVAELRGRELVPVLGAADGSIVARIRRLVTGVDPAVGGWPLPAFAMAGLVGLVLTLGLAATTAADGPADDRRLLEDPDSLRSLTPAQAELLREFMPLENEVAIARGIPAMSLPLRGLKTLDAETARVLSAGFKKAHVGVLLLDGLTTLDADTAQALATPRGSFPAQVSLGGLTTIDAATAAQLVTIQGLWLNGLTSLTPEAARALATGKPVPAGGQGGRPAARGQLSLNGLETLSPEAAAALAVVPRHVLNLDGLTTLPRDVAKGFVNTKISKLSLNGLKSLAPEAAASLLSSKAIKDLSLNGLTRLTPDAARALAGVTTVHLDGLTEIDGDLARAIVEAKPLYVHMNGLATLTPETMRVLREFPGQGLRIRVKTLDVSAARELTTPNRHTILLDVEEPTRDVADVLLARNLHALRNRLTVLAPEGVLSPATASKLAASGEPDGIGLPGITAFTAPDSVAVAAALATAKGRLSLPNLKKISPKTLSALIAKEDVQIPLIETLELIPEPDGSESDDFVIPKTFQERQTLQRK
jgi:hypothetical protein